MAPPAGALESVYDIVPAVLVTVAIAAHDDRSGERSTSARRRGS